MKELLANLCSRLPELEWKIKGLSPSTLSYGLPRGLFVSSTELSGAQCIAEIKADIQALSAQKHHKSAVYLAQKIQRKINILVVLYQVSIKKQGKTSAINFGIKMLSTRQQWIQNLESEIALLETQKQALVKTLEQMKDTNSISMILSVQQELGEVDKHLTLAQETLMRSVS